MPALLFSVLQLDCYDHGTKVASVAATANGVAPGALLGIYRIFGCQGVSTDGVIIPAFDRAVRDGCHIINLSAADTAGYEERVSAGLHCAHFDVLVPT
jgi:subtilisin family serine protease